VDETEEGGALGDPCSSPDQDDQARMLPISREGQEVIAIACHQNRAAPAGVVEHRGVIRGGRELLSQANDLVPRFEKHPRNSVRNVVVQEEPQASGSAIWRAIRWSISAMWSS
jgi:hypothetical protein